MADFTDMLAYLLALGPKVGELFLRKLYRCAYDVTESQLSRASVCELSSGRVGQFSAAFSPALVSLY